MNKLRWSDIWLLVAAYIAMKNGCDRIKDIIGVADMMNHAVANLEELSSAMVRLEESGYVRIGKNPWRMICTDKAVELVEPIARKNSRGYRIWKQVEKKLGVRPWIPGEPLPHPENNLLYEDFFPAKYRKEVNAYLACMKSD